MSKTGFRVLCIVGFVGLLNPALATEQVYHPISPALGGNPANGAFLLSTAQAQGEGVNSGNQGPDLSGLTSALSGLGTGTTGGTGGAAGAGATQTTSTTPTTQNRVRNTVANPLGGQSGMP
jgi:curli production assembly/transport component CsgF